MAIGNVNELMGVSKGEVAMLEDAFLGSGIILSDSTVVSTGRELCRDVLLVFSEFCLPVWVGPENCFTIFLESSAPVTLHVDPTCLPCSSLTDCEFFTSTKLDRIIVLGLDGLVVLNDGSKINMSVAEDVMPEGVREKGGSPLGHQGCRQHSLG